MPACQAQVRHCLPYIESSSPFDLYKKRSNNIKKGKMGLNPDMRDKDFWLEECFVFL